MNILYVSTLCSDRLIKELFDSGYKPISAIQKFNKLLVRGLVENGCNVHAISEIPKTNAPKFYRRKSESEARVNYTYSRKVDIKFVYNLFVFLSGFFLTLSWGLRYRKSSGKVNVSNGLNENNNHRQKKSSSKKERVAILDVLQTELCLGALLACKMLKIKAVGVVTDLPRLPGLLIGGKRILIHRYIEKVINKYANSFDSYVLLTEQMNEVVNRKARPYMIMEGLVDAEMIDSNAEVGSNGRKIVIYAGGLYEKYGIKYLVDGFKMLDDKDAELHLFGHGTMVSEIEKEAMADDRIRYFGIVHNSKVVEAELQATLLVNPRPTIEDFTKYSFPSKNMEYMVSGTPVLTTRLPGMPQEYHEHVYMLEEVSPEVIRQTLTKLLIDTPAEELRLKGLKAKQFVIENKNNIYQSKRVIDFIKMGSDKSSIQAHDDQD